MKGLTVATVPSASMPSRMSMMSVSSLDIVP
jgi:hypothetical protein